MATQNFSCYNPLPPTPGLTLINIVRVEKKGGITCIYYDIGIGPSAG